MTPDDMGEHLRQVIKTIQKNVFKCLGCGTKVEFADDANQLPIFPCDCGKIKWRVHSINDTVVYK